MLTFRQAKDVIDYAGQLHRHLAECYESQQERLPEEKLKLLMGYLASHERHLADVLANYEETAAQQIREMWMQYVPSSEVEESLQCAVIRPDMEVDEIVDVVLRFDEAVLTLYREIRDETSDPNIKAVFQNLIDMQQKEQQRTVRNALMLREI